MRYEAHPISNWRWMNMNPSAFPPKPYLQWKISESSFQSQTAAMAAALASSLHLSAPLLNSSPLSIKAKAHPKKQNLKQINRRGLRVRAAKDESGEDPSVPTWARPGSDEPPPWARQESQKDTSASGFEVPFYVYLIASSITAIAAIGSVFEYVNQKPVFGVLSSDSIFYAPVLGFFAFTGIPSSAFLWYKSVQAANKEAEEQDRRDGFL